jgi:succinate-acetate transporter protein
MMKMTLVTLAVAMALLAFGASEASAWVCRAGGIGGTTLGWSWNVIDAKLIALRKCERRSPIPVCTILHCW